MVFTLSLDKIDLSHTHIHSSTASITFNMVAEQGMASPINAVTTVNTTTRLSVGGGESNSSR